MYVKAINGTVVAYPYSLKHLRGGNPNVSFPKEVADSLLAEFNVFKVAEVAPPFSTTTQDPVEQTPQRINGTWTQVWAMVDVPPKVAAKRQQDAADEAELQAAKADTFVKNFIGMTPAQVDNYVENNTANLASVRALMKKMVFMLLILARKEFR